ncbi:MAG: hypothetical protein RLZZ444_3255 [Pseudomonadota bacterium]
MWFLTSQEGNQVLNAESGIVLALPRFIAIKIDLRIFVKMDLKSLEKDQAARSATTASRISMPLWVQRSRELPMRSMKP